MRILYLHQYFCPPGGSGNNRSYELARHWIAAGHQVTMVTTPAYFPDEQKRAYLKQKKASPIDIDGIETWVLKVDYSHMYSFVDRVQSFLKFYFALLKISKSLDPPDLIYASSTPPSVGEAGRRISKRWEIPYIFETVDVWPDVPHGMGFLNNVYLRDFLYARVNRIYEEASAIVSLSPGMKAQVMTHRVPDEKVFVSLNGTNLDNFEYYERKRSEQVCVLYSGTVGHANGVTAILHAAKILEGNSRIRFVILGDGNDLANVKREAEEMELGNVEFRNKVPKEKVASILKEADIGISCFANHAVLEANSANKFYDYHASGLPVVTNYEGWQKEIMDINNSGLSSPQGDSKSFAANIEKLANEPELRLEMGKNARKLAEAEFNRRQIATELLNLFQKVIEGPISH